MRLHRIIKSINSSAFICVKMLIIKAAKIVIDPNVKNLRAIGCYEKCGFLKVKLLSGHDLHEGKYQDC